MPDLPKPPQLHDRKQEWDAVSGFATDPELGAKLGIVYGRRRQGKTLLLDLLAQAVGGFVFTALPLSSGQNLDRLSRAYARHVGGADVAFRTWDSAIDGLLRLGERPDGQPALVFIDEFQYLVDAEPSLPSVLQVALGPTSRAITQSRVRLVLCGSALSIMQGLLAGSAPLRGRAVLEMMVHPFRYRDAASFWGVHDDPDLAFRIDALVGGTPAYRAMAGRAPAAAPDFERWVVAGPMSPTSALFREGNVLLAEEPELADKHIYTSVLSAIARGTCRRSEIAGVLGRSEQSLSHPLAVLARTRLIERADDAFRQRRPVFRLAEPIIRTHQLLVGPYEADLVGGAGERVWGECADTVSSKIYGPHFEELARQWCLWHAGRETLDGHASSVRSATLPCAVHREQHELDVVVEQRRPGERDLLLAIGEAKSTGRLVGQSELARLDHLRELIPPDRVPSDLRLLLFSRSGFTTELRAAASARPGVELVGLDRLYHGD